LIGELLGFSHALCVEDDPLFLTGKILGYDPGKIVKFSFDIGRRHAGYDMDKVRCAEQDAEGKDQDKRNQDFGPHACA